MDFRLNERQRSIRDEARRFASSEIAPWAEQSDQDETTPVVVLDAVRRSKYLGAALAAEWGGGGVDPLSYGLLTEEIGSVCSSVRTLLTIHNMSAQAVAQFGTQDQQACWLPELCSGSKIIAFALSEPEVGSAASTIQARAVKHGNHYLLNGTKKWVSFGQVADLFLIFALCDGRPVALVVDRDSDGLKVKSLTGIFGTRGSMLAEVTLNEVRVERDRQLGPTGAGLAFVANLAVDHGRFSVAWGSTGIIRACLDASLAYAHDRRQGKGRLRDYQLVRRHLADMLVAHTASRALCYRSACLRDQGDPRAVMETSLAKYHSAAAAIQVANVAVHLHGANGCSAAYPVSRYLRDATVMGIVEGTHELNQLALSNYAFQRPHLTD